MVKFTRYEETTPKIIETLDTQEDEVSNLKKKISKLTADITRLNTNLRVKDQQIMALTETEDYNELKLIEDAIIDKVKAFEINLKRYYLNNNTTEEELLKLPRVQQPKNLREKVDYQKILEEMVKK